MAGILVTMTQHQDVPAPIVEKIAGEFLEYLDGLGYRLKTPTGIPDDTAYATLAAEFVAHVQDSNEGRIR